MIFVCPKCRGRLSIGEDKSLRCDAGHTYDKSRQGYYNLLLSSKGGMHGDNKEMVAARREFLSRGFYKPLADKIADTCSGLVSGSVSILDAGCGEGYYTRAIKERVPKAARIAAFDISKDAIKEAAKKECADEYAVASSYRIPVEDSSIDLVVNTFSPLAIEEMTRIVRKNGYFVMAIPAEEHLFGLKSKIYDTPYKNEVASSELSGFTLIEAQELKYRMRFDTPSDIRALFMMTPYAYRTNKEGRDKILNMKELECDAHFLIFTYKKD